jgi:hypothetical protein
MKPGKLHPGFKSFTLFVPVKVVPVQLGAEVAANPEC